MTQSDTTKRAEIIDVIKNLDSLILIAIIVLGVRMYDALANNE